MPLPQVSMSNMLKAARAFLFLRFYILFAIIIQETMVLRFSQYKKITFNRRGVSNEKAGIFYWRGSFNGNFKRQ